MMLFMSDIAILYVSKANYIYDCTSKLAKEKADSFSELTNFRKYIAENIEIIKQFKGISRDICRIIDSRIIDSRYIFIKLEQIKIVNDLVSQVKTNIYKTKNSFTNAQVAGYEKLIEDCFNDMTIDTIGNYKTKLDNTNKRLPELLILLDKHRIEEEQQRSFEEWMAQLKKEREQKEAEEQRRTKERRVEEQLQAEQRRIQEQHLYEEQQRHLEQQNRWQAQGLCRYCGGKLSMFGHKCKSCGKQN